MMPLENIQPSPDNDNIHPPEQLAVFEKILATQGWRRPIVLSRLSRTITRGHGALLAARQAGQAVAPVEWQTYASQEEERADRIADNQLARLASTDEGKLSEILKELKGASFDMALTAVPDDAITRLIEGIKGQANENSSKAAALGNLAQRFGIPPFTVLDARQGYWQDRKRAWIALGIASEQGRGDNLLGMSLQTIVAQALGCGYDEAARIVAEEWRNFARLVQSPLDNGTPAEVTTFEGVALDPFYEAKCVPFLEPGDLLWVVGHRPVAQTPESTPRGNVTVHWHSSEDMSEVASGSVKLFLGASVFLGKGATWEQYEALYRKVYCENAKRVLAENGFLVVIQTDAYEDGGVLAKNQKLPLMLEAEGWRMIDTKVWERRAGDFFQVPFSQVFVFVKDGAKHGRASIKNRDYFQGVWRYPQSKGGELAAYPIAMCKMLLETFTQPGDLVADPFAGTGTILGVAAALNRNAVGYEINEELRNAIAESLEFRDAEQPLCMMPAEAVPPRWITSNSLNLESHVEPESVDLVFSCPPYADLEVYSDMPDDLSAVCDRDGYAKFLEQYREIIRKAVARLKPNRFCVWVVGDVRDKETGRIRGFIPDTIKAFEDAGAAYYNDAILVTALGSLPMRAGKIFTSKRKLGRTHQNVLVFIKGDEDEARTWDKSLMSFGEIEADAEA